MAIKVGINGFGRIGRIGRNLFRSAMGDSGIEFVAVNDLTSPATLAHLLKYDSILGNLKHDIQASGNCIKVEGKELRVFSEKEPAALDWDSVGAQIVVALDHGTGSEADGVKPFCRRSNPGRKKDPSVQVVS